MTKQERIDEIMKAFRMLQFYEGRMDLINSTSAYSRLEVERRTLSGVLSWHVKDDDAVEGGDEPKR